MCKILKISRSTYYCYEEYETKKDEINDIVVKIFNENQHVYGTRKLKVELAKINWIGYNKLDSFFKELLK